MLLLFFPPFPQIHLYFSFPPRENPSHVEDLLLLHFVWVMVRVARAMPLLAPDLLPPTVSIPLAKAKLKTSQGICKHRSWSPAGRDARGASACPWCGCSAPLPLAGSAWAGREQGTGRRGDVRRQEGDVLRADIEGPSSQGKDPSAVFWPTLVRLNWGLGKVGLAAESLDTNAGMGSCSGETLESCLFCVVKVCD